MIDSEDLIPNDCILIDENTNFEEHIGKNLLIDAQWKKDKIFLNLFVLQDILNV